jgi:hypothetical protein
MQRKIQQARTSRKLAKDSKIISDEIKSDESKLTSEMIQDLEIEEKLSYNTPECANDIWKNVYALLATPWKEESFNTKINVMYKKYPKFSTQFPVVVKYMVEDGIYCHKSFIQYLKKIKANPPNNQEKYAERQADYIKYCIMNSPGNTDHVEKIKKANYFWHQVKDSIMEEFVTMKDDQANAKQKVKDDIAQLAATRKDRLISIMKQDPNMVSKVIDYRKEQTDVAEKATIKKSSSGKEKAAPEILKEEYGPDNPPPAEIMDRGKYIDVTTKEWEDMVEKGLVTVQDHDTQDFVGVITDMDKVRQYQSLKE